MGIQRLFGHLAPYIKTTVLGCTNSKCHNHSVNKYRSVVIDGPSFVFSIYHRLLSWSSSRDALEAQPSYRDLGHSCVGVLRLLERCGLEIKHVFFDGALPIEKRPVREERLQLSLTKLLGYRQSLKDGFKVSHNDLQILTAEQLLTEHRPSWGRKNLPPPAFIVPSVYENLKLSEYAGRTHLVPGEADTYLASAMTGMTNSMCVSDDTDLAILDIGGGLHVYNDSFDVQKCSICNEGSVLSANSLQQEALLGLLGPQASVPHLVDLGYEVKKDPHVTLTEACSRVRKLLQGVPRAIDDQAEFTEFAKDYTQQVDVKAIESIPEWRQQLDNRTSELVMQVLAGDVAPRNFLLSLVEDPSRSSAWLPSRPLRRLAYSALLSKTDATAKLVVEVDRSGQRIVGTNVQALSADEMQSQLEWVHGMEKEVAWRMGRNRATLAQVRLVFATSYLCSQLPVQTATGSSGVSREQLEAALGNLNDEELSWDHVHLRAQIYATAYSLRMLNQVLRAPSQPENGHIMTTASSNEILPIQNIILDQTSLSRLGIAKQAQMILNLASLIRHEGDPNIESQPEDGEASQHSRASPEQAAGRNDGTRAQFNHARNDHKLKGARLKKRTRAPHTRQSEKPFETLRKGN